MATYELTCRLPPAARLILSTSSSGRLTVMRFIQLSYSSALRAGRPAAWSPLSSLAALREKFRDDRDMLGGAHAVPLRGQRDLHHRGHRLLQVQVHRPLGVPQRPGG